MTERISRRGPVIERASEPGVSRGAVRLAVVAALLAGAYWSGLIPDAGRLERNVQDTIVAVNDLWRSWTGDEPAAAPAPTRVARPVIAPPISRPDPPRSSAVQPPSPPATPNFNEIIANARKALEGASSSAAPKAPEAAPAAKPSDDPFAESFRRNILGQLRSGAPSGPAVASAPPPPPRPVADRGSMFSRPPGAPASPVAAEALDDYVGKHLNAFNASRDVPVKRAAIEKVVAAAELGHGPARGVVVRGFPVSTIIRTVVQPEDAVRFALDFIIHKRAFSNDARRDFIALAAWFDAEQKDDALGAALFDAVRDDPRLQTADAMNDLMALLDRADHGCAALRRRLNLPDSGAAAGGRCDLAAATAEKARQAGPAGVEKKRFEEALQLVRKTLGSPT